MTIMMTPFCLVSRWSCRTSTHSNSNSNTPLPKAPAAATPRVNPTHAQPIDPPPPLPCQPPHGIRSSSQAQVEEATWTKWCCQAPHDDVLRLPQLQTRSSAPSTRHGEYPRHRRRLRCALLHARTPLLRLTL